MAEGSEALRGSAQSIRLDPTKSDPIRVNPDKSDGMKPIIDCNCTMAGMARWIATPVRDGRRQEKDVRSKSGTLDSIPLLSLLSSYRARRGLPRFTRSRSTSLLDCHAQVLLPETVLSSRCRGGNHMDSFFKTNPYGGRVQIRKTPFSTGKRTFRFAQGPVTKHIFTKRTQMRGCKSAQQTANPQVI
jgi:hypothetical protein